MPGEPYLDKCPQCGCAELFVRKDFPKIVGLAIAAGAGLSFLTLAGNPRTFAASLWVLLGSAFLLLIVFIIAGRYTICYRCRAEFHDSRPNPSHHPFDPAIARKYPPPLPKPAPEDSEDL